MSSDLFVTAHQRFESYRIGLVSTYPPKHCGLATFAAALENGLMRAGHQVEVIGVDDGNTASPSERLIAAELLSGDRQSMEWSVAVLSTCDVAIIQHEYGIYGGPDGDEVIDLLESLNIPTIVTLHTVPSHPTLHQRQILVSMGEIADRVVVMSEAAGNLLRDLYQLDSAKIVTIPHGASVPDIGNSTEFNGPGHPRPQMLTWGFIGPGKGIENVIEAVALLADMKPLPNYTVAGITHPKVLAREGDRYRQSLIELAKNRGVSDLVKFDDKYRDVEALGRFVASSSLVILPYDSREQVTSGVLVDSIAAGRPVIATAFPHAVEMLKSGAGLVVPHQDPQALADAIRTIMSSSLVAEKMTSEAKTLARFFSWNVVASEYALLVDELIRARRLVRT